MRYVMLTQDNCKYCTAALGLLQSYGHEVEVYDVKNESVASLVRLDTVPQLYGPDEEFIGGYMELIDHLAKA